MVTPLRGGLTVRARRSSADKRGRGRRAPRDGASRRPGSPGTLSEERILDLQESAGNRAVVQLLAGSAPEDLRPPPPTAESSSAGAPGADAAELQARAHGERLSGALEGIATPAPGPLPEDVRTVAAAHLGVDLAGTRITVADEQRDDVGDALAWARGDELGFRPGQLTTASGRGRALLGHELTHAAQQRGTVGSLTQHNDPDDALASDRLASSPRLQKAFRNRPPVRKGERGDAVGRIQQTLIDDGFDLPISTAKTGSPDEIFGGETRDAVKAFQRKHGLADDGVVGHDTLGALDVVAGGGGPVPGDQPLAPALKPGESTRTHTPDDYIEAWERKHGRKITEEERALLAKGCIGITALNLQRGDVAPSLALSFSTLEKALAVRNALNRILQAKPAIDRLPDEVAAEPALLGLRNVLDSIPVDPDPTVWRAVIFSKRFYSNQAEAWEDRLDPDDKAFQPDEDTGQVDMSGYHYRGRPEPDEGVGAEFTNFDYGWLDEDTGDWWHANHAEPGMEVYQSTLAHYSQPLADFDRQVFSVAFARMP